MKTQKQFLENFCANVRNLREKNGLEREEMAKRLGIGIGSLRKIEDGIVPPRLLCDVLVRIDREFGISPDRIFLPIEESGAR